jgi:diguanylate cyclase (GGDEF)-like protein
MSDDEGRAATLSVADIDALILEGRFGKTDLSLRRLDALVASLEQGSDVEAFLLALYGRALLLRRLGDRTDDVIEACDVLERTAQSHQDSTWAAVACATRAEVRIDLGELGTAMSDVARADRELDRVDLGTSAGFRLFGVLATVYARLRLPDQMDDARTRMDAELDAQHPAHRAMHWSAWSTELVVRAMEPVAAGSTEPEPEAIRRAVDLAGRVAALPVAEVPEELRRISAAVRALAAALAGRGTESLRLLGQDAFPGTKHLPAVERQIVTLAAMRSHTLVGALAIARQLDEAARSSQQLENQLMLELCRARERLYLETHAGGDLVPILNRLSQLLVRLGWRGMQLVSDAARQTLQHHTLHAESRTDPLTGVGNRRALDEELRQLLRFSPLPMSLVLVDIDDFKNVNDKFTHVVGDEVLRRVAATLTQQLRTGDRLLRFGGDEFVVLLPRIGDQEANHVAARMAAAVADRSWGELADGLQVTVTTGCAALWSLTGRRPDGDAERLFRRADEALLESKRRRKRDTGSLSAVGAALATGPIPLPPASGSIPQPVPQPVPQLVPQPVGERRERWPQLEIATAGAGLPQREIVATWPSEPEPPRFREPGRGPVPHVHDPLRDPLPESAWQTETALEPRWGAPQPAQSPPPRPPAPPELRRSREPLEPRELEPRTIAGFTNPNGVRPVPFATPRPAGTATPATGWTPPQPGHSALTGPLPVTASGPATPPDPHPRPGPVTTAREPNRADRRGYPDEDDDYSPLLSRPAVIDLSRRSGRRHLLTSE